MEPEATPAFSRDLIERILSGDESAWEQLYLSYRDKLLFAIRCRLGMRLRARIESEDILHSVFRDAFAKLREFEADSDEALGHYLHVCVLNKIRNKAAYFAAKRRASDVPLSDSILERIPQPVDSAPSYTNNEYYTRLERALEALPPQLREVVLLRSVDGLTNQQAASVLERSPAATSKLYNRALARLGRLVDGWPASPRPPEEGLTGNDDSGRR